MSREGEECVETIDNLMRRFRVKEVVLRVNSNIASLRTQVQMQRTSKALQRALERMSSGQRVNSARDDASGLARGVGLESQVRGLNRAILNMNEAQGMLMTAEGALQTQMDLVQRMRELAVQAANGTLTSNDRANLDQELQSLLAEFNRITRDTKLNGAALLDGSLGTQKIQVGTEKNQSVDLKMGSMGASGVFRKDVGSGAFTQTSTLAVSGTVSMSEFADLNGDGHLDLIVATELGFQVLDGKGDGTFAAARTVFAGFVDNNFGFENYNRFAVGDVTGDGNLDIVFNGSSVLAGDGRGGFGEETVGQIPQGNIQLADFNGDGALDIVTSNVFDVLNRITLSDGNGGFLSPENLEDTPNGGSAVVGDFNSDGHQDVIILDRSYNSVTLYAGNGTGELVETVSSFLVGSIYPTLFEVSDFDSDGDLDLILGDGTTVRLATNNGSGSFVASSTAYSMGASVRDIRSQDLNDDGRVDLVVKTDSSISVSLGQGGGVFSSRVTVASGLNAFALGDVTGDGVVDFFGSSGSSELVYRAVLTKAAAANEVRIQTQEQAEKLLGILDNAIDRISEERSNLGALSHRLDYAQSVTSQTRENLASARSQIMDADLAEETAELTRLQILQQAQASVLAQSNLSLRIALQLLSF